MEEIDMLAMAKGIHDINEVVVDITTGLEKIIDNSESLTIEQMLFIKEVLTTQQELINKLYECWAVVGDVIEQHKNE